MRPRIRSSLSAGIFTLEARSLKGERRTAGIGDDGGFVADLAVEHLDLAHIEVAQLQAHAHFARNDIARARERLNRAHGPDLTAGHAGDDAVHGLDEFRRRQQGILPSVHRGRPRVVGEAVYGHVPYLDAHDAFDDTDVDLFGIEIRALLDMQLEIGGDIAAVALDASDPVRIAADEADAVADGLAAPASDRHGLLRQLPANRLATDKATLFVLEDDEFQRMPRDDVGLGQGLRRFDGTQRTNIAVVIAAFGHRVDMRAEYERRQSRIASGAAADKVARGIDRGVEPGRAHQAHDVVAALLVGLGIGDPTDSAERVLAELRQRGEMIGKAFAVHAQRGGVLRGGGRGDGRRGGEKRKRECAPVHSSNHAMPPGRRNEEEVGKSLARMYVMAARTQYSINRDL